MVTPQELREQSRLCQAAAAETKNPHFRRRLASQALALAQLAEKIEREGAKEAAAQSSDL